MSDMSDLFFVNEEACCKRSWKVLGRWVAPHLLLPPEEGNGCPTMDFDISGIRVLI